MLDRSDFSSEADFRHAAEPILDVLWNQVDELDLDEAEPQRTPGSLVILFEDDSVFMLSLQTPVHELWLSANYTAWHFLCEAGQWVERDSQETLVTVLNQLLSDKLQQSVHLTL